MRFGRLHVSQLVTHTFGLDHTLELAACVALYAGRICTVTARTARAEAPDRPDRVTSVRVTVVPPPAASAQRHAAMSAVASPCTVRSTLHQPPEITIALKA
ncbi:hypothetical protein [Streptomyces sp. NPDC003635]